MSNPPKGPTFPTPDSAIEPSSAEHIAAARDLFWQNVLREALTTLSVASSARPRTPEAAKAAKGGDMFDGRVAVLTHGGDRVPIADVFPLFACGINTDAAQKALSIAVECTVFQIRTPDGQVFTLPLHEIRALHVLSPELMNELEKLAREQEGGDESDRIKRPFGFAAFTGEQPKA